MALSQTEELENLIEKLVTSGKQVLDVDIMKKLKFICKHDNSCLEHCFHILSSQLLKEHCEIRYSAFLIIKELFLRSHLFRTLLLNNFHQYMDCTIETDFDNPLPPPKAIADKLKEDALLAIKEWHDKYGVAYLKLSLAVDFLKQAKKFKFDHSQPSRRNLVLEERLSRKQIVNGIKVDKLNKEMQESMWEIKNVIAGINNCLKLLVPSFKEENRDLFDGGENSGSSALAVSLNDGEDDIKEPILRGAGITERGYVVQLDLSRLSSVEVNENEDNKAVFDHLKDLKQSAHRIHLPHLKQWLGMASKCGASSDLIKTLIDVKNEIEQSIAKCNDIKVINNHSDDDSYDDFVDVPEMVFPQNANRPNHQKVIPNNKGTTSLKNQYKKSTNIWKPLQGGDQDLNDPTTYMYALAKQAQVKEMEKFSKPRKLKKIFPAPVKSEKADKNMSSLKEKAPVVSFGRDLLTWDVEKYKELKSSITLGAPKEFDLGHRFYGGNSASETDRGLSDAALSSITSRTIEFTGEFKPVLRTCSAPLPNGKLCPRQDRYKCPFHGKIIPRNADGYPITNTDLPSTSAQSNNWNDKEFLKDLEANLGSGVSLMRKTKKTKKAENGLTDLKKIKHTSRSRLQKKILSVKSLKRVAETMNELDAKRNLDKFGNNFNYALH